VYNECRYDQQAYMDGRRQVWRSIAHPHGRHWALLTGVYIVSDSKAGKIVTKAAILRRAEWNWWWHRSTRVAADTPVDSITCCMHRYQRLMSSMQLVGLTVQLIGGAPTMEERVPSGRRFAWIGSICWDRVTPFMWLSLPEEYVSPTAARSNMRGKTKLN
jgi:hypothetical protein